MAATQLEIYNGALLHLSERKLAALTDAGEPRRVLDTIWNARAIETCLEMGQFTFATRAAALSYAPSITPAFGYARAFNKPTDWIRTVQLCIDEAFHFPLIAVLDQGGYLFADPDTIYLRYVSNDAAYGGDMSLWPESFSKLLELYMAYRSARRIASAAIAEEVEKKFKSAKIEANGIDGTNKPTQPLPMGGWARSRWGGSRTISGRGPDR